MSAGLEGKENAGGQVEQSGEELARVLDFTPVMLLRCGADLSYRYANAAFLKVIGMTRAELIGKRVPDVLGERLYERIRPYIEMVLAGQSVEYEIEASGILGKGRWLQSAYRPERNERGEVVGWIASLVDITEKKRTAGHLEQLKNEVEKELAERERAEEASSRLAAIVESSDDAIISKDLNGIITSWNGAAQRLYGYTPEEIIGKPILTLIPPDRYDEEPGILQRIRRGERIDHYETVRKCKDGSLVDISLTVSPVLDRDGRVIGASKIARDITEKKRSEETLRLQYQMLAEMDQKKNEFLAVLGHELRNPLAAIKNSAELLAEGADQETLKWATGVVNRQTALLSRLVDDLLDVARITRGHIQLRRDTLDISPVVRRAVETARPLISERHHELEVDLPEQPLLLSADSSRLEQILVNLLTNAAKYMDSGGTISLSAKKLGEEVVVVVKDTGIGIAPELLSEIFDMFVQEPRGLDRSRGGLGLGLALARRLANMHGGSLTAASEGPGRGSEFTLRLPALPAAAAGEANEEPGSGNSAVKNSEPGLRVLVVDDNRDGAIGLCRLLEKRGHDANVAHDSIEALGIARRIRPEVFLLDIGLPEKNGFELAEELQKSGFENALYLSVSGYAQAQDLEKSRRAGFLSHFTKPVQLEEMIRTINDWAKSRETGLSRIPAQGYPEGAVVRSSI